MTGPRRRALRLPLPRLAARCTPAQFFQPLADHLLVAAVHRLIIAPLFRQIRLRRPAAFKIVAVLIILAAAEAFGPGTFRRGVSDGRRAGPPGEVRVRRGSCAAADGLSGTGLAPGTYAVEASWGPFYNQSTNAPYAIYDGGSLVQVVTADQTKTPSGASAGGVPFQILTHVTITSGTLTVVLSNSGNNTYVIADALRVE